MRKPDCQKCREDSKGDYNRLFFSKCNACKKMRDYRKYLQDKRLFYEGEVINDLEELLKQQFVMLRGSTKHIEVIKCMQLRTVQLFLSANYFRHAIRKDKPI